ncbi:MULTISPECIES: 2-oxoacid:acceptor oxidoreductase subunit alpha [Halanaerobium]|jgi:2-oxoglutarate ferredoxin oxidoreductase subunit alpha|uniref:2-oxoglutarate ferredoxin oxidoreductase subunit alpha n=1 Tax=Halanaerobium congolense TaxID=54121 RepID=A0A4R8GBM4_9FIRM|nr:MULTISPECIES: 2-oxoacid:acceptor oxidoreductase subunit alpha [Halanaerobium]PUU86787.1 MAG: 2-oxoglutarate ferredoxin oxidoreductase subunit alpha [Halanaerobium sp.]TDX42425.1 2-oxoglutarate ferredoxin oxidoreductase subunit alpha [Halanaerobium congolense]
MKTKIFKPKKSAVLTQGNQAVVEGALAAGVEFFAGYPITPASEIAEGFARELPQIGGKFLQMEDEIAGMAAVIGASLAGKKAITATSGPGFALKQENLGFATMIEVPVVVVNVQRVGPSTGLPTAPSQGDVMQTRWGRNGDQEIIALAPSSVAESYELTIKAVNLSEKFRQPVVLLLDEVIGHLREKIHLKSKEEIEIYNRKKPESNQNSDQFLPYQLTDDLIPPMADYGSGFKYHTSGLFHDQSGFPDGKKETAKFMQDRLHNKLHNNLDQIIFYEKNIRSDDNAAVLSYGSAARAAISTVNTARKDNLKAGWFKLQTIWPFAEEAVAELAAQVDTIIVPELNQGQLIREVKKAAAGRAKVIGINSYAGDLIRPEEIRALLEEVL